MMDEKKLIRELKKLLGPTRFKHSLRVRDSVLRLSKFHKVDLKKARLAGLLHDSARYMDRQGFLKMAKELKMKVGRFEKAEPKLLHAALSAYVARTKFGIHDKQVLKAIKLHTLGSRNMSTLDKLIYVADHTEEARNHKGVKIARKLAKTDLNKAVAYIAGSTLQYLIDSGLPVHPRTREVRNYFLLKHDKKK
jgi:predicted HD superfamily hydrolase involved in NAD metabolism